MTSGAQPVDDRETTAQIATLRAGSRVDMKSSRQDETEGKIHKVTGSIKEIAGKVTGNRKLQRKGKAEKIAGKVQEKVGQVKEVLGR